MCFLGALLIHLETISKYLYIGIRTRTIILKWHVPEQLADAFLIGTYPHRLDAVEKQGWPLDSRLSISEI